MTIRTFLIAALMAAGLGLALAAPAGAEPAAGTIWTEPATGIDFVWIPGGATTIGCSGDGCPATETPAHPATVKGFWLSRTEITQGQWKTLMEDNPSKFRKGETYPVDQVNWEMAHAFIAKLNKSGRGTFRLPTEAEWEYACRGGVANEPFCGGVSPEVVAWLITNSKMSTQPVATRSPNRFGLYDMSGNLFEWVEDCWNDSHAGAPADGRARTDGACEARVLRGGSWGNYAAQAHASTRRNDGEVKCPFIGLRVALDR